MAYGWTGDGEIVLTYRFDPETAGPPERAIVTEAHDGSVGWWVLGVGRSRAERVGDARRWRSDRWRMGSTDRSLTDDEVHIRERLWAYLDDRHAYEVRMSGAGPAVSGETPADQLAAEPDAAHASYRRPHLTDRAMAAIARSKIDGRPSVDPARTTITDVTIDDASATVSTLENEHEGRLPPARFEYRLECEDGHWLLDERRRFDVAEGGWLQQSL
jgi:hypothetical protein